MTNVQITDGVYGPAAVKGANTSAAIADPALVTTDASIGLIGNLAPSAATYVAGVASAGGQTWADGTIAPLSVNSNGGALRVEIAGVQQSASFDVNNKYLLTGGAVSASAKTYADDTFNLLSLNTQGSLRVDIQGIPVGTTYTTSQGHVLSGALVSASGQSWSPGTVAPLNVNPVGGALRVEGAIVQSGNAAVVKGAYSPPLAADAALVVAMSPNSTIGMSAPALTKGVQGANGFSVQNLKDAGRVIKTYVASGTTGVTSEGMIALTAYADFVSSGAAFSFAVTPGKKLRLQTMVLTWRNGTANAGAVQVRFRANNGLVIASSPVQFALLAEATTTAVGHGSSVTMAFPDGFELSGSMQFGLTQLATGAVGGFDVSIIGYEY